MTRPPARVFEFKASNAQAGKRLDLAVTESLEALTRSQVKALIENGLIAVDGVRAEKAGRLLEPGEMVRVEIPAPEKLDLAPRDVGITILYEDEHLAVLDKPAGISVHPSETERSPTVVHGLLFKLASLSSVGGVERPGIVHRIDKGTSGTLVVSKTDATHLGLSAQFKDHSIDRRYRALVYGDLARAKPAKHGRIETFFGRNPNHRKKMTGKLKTGRVAITNWQVIEELGPLTLVECRLETGRTHQIRVHLAELGFPIVGDPLYCDNEKRAATITRGSRELGRACASLDHQLLHAYRLGFRHPVTNKQLEFEAPFPLDFEQVLALAREAR